MNQFVRWLTILALLGASSAGADDRKQVEAQAKAKGARENAVQPRSEEARQKRQERRDQRIAERAARTGNEDLAEDLAALQASREAVRVAREELRKATAAQGATGQGGAADSAQVEQAKRRAEEAAARLAQARQQLRGHEASPRSGYGLAQGEFRAATARLETGEKADDAARRQQRQRGQLWKNLSPRLATAARQGRDGYSAELKSELALHARRAARLARVRALAEVAKDQPSVAQCEQLLDKEVARHARVINELLPAPRPRKPAAPAAPGAAEAEAEPTQAQQQPATEEQP